MSSPHAMTQYAVTFQVGRAGRFGTKGLSVSFIATEGDKDILNQVQNRFEVDVPVLPDEMDVSTYSTCTICVKLILVSVIDVD